MTRYAKRKLKYSLNENFNLLPYVEWDRFVTLTGAQAEWGLRYRIYGHWYNIVVYFTKKVPFRVPTILGEFNGKICSEWPQNASPTIWNFKIFRGKTPVSWRNPRLPERGVSPSRALPHLRLRRSVRASGTQLSPYFVNWNSYFNSFWEPCNIFLIERKQWFLWK